MGWHGDKWIYTKKDIKKAIASAKSGVGYSSDAGVDLYLAMTALKINLNECYDNINAIQNWLNGNRDPCDLMIKNKGD